MADPTTNKPSKHIPVLDGVRAIAVLMIMVFHFFQHGPALSSGLLRGFGKVAALGQNGVDLFFVLSGFLITGILLDLRGKSHALRTFYIRRTARIFPLYYAYLLAVFLVLPLLHWVPAVAFEKQWWFWVYGQNIQDTFIPGFELFGPGHFWSLAVEEHFYLVWPFLVMGLPASRLKPVLLGMVGVAIATRAVMVYAGYPVFYFTLCRMDTLALGALLAVLARDAVGLAPLASWLRRRGWWFALALIPLYVLFSGTANPMVQIVKFTLFALLCAAGLVLALTAAPDGFAARLLGSQPAGRVAKVSYALYVFHPAVFDWWRPVYGHWPFALSLVAALVTTGVVATISWHVLENPALQLRDLLLDHLRRRRIAAASNAVPVNF